MSGRYSKQICSVDGCCRNDRVVHGMCGMHYQRWVKTGTTDTSKRYVCTMDGCNQRHQAQGLCDAHYSRLKRTGSPHIVRQRQYAKGEDSPLWQGADITYTSAHFRVIRDRGPARDHQCIDCGTQAIDWSYDHSDPDEKVSEWGPYSPNPDHYQARCKPCHSHFDRYAQRPA